MRLIDADALMFYVRQHWGELYPKDGTMIDAILVAPTVNAVEVVRCKECKRYYADPWGYGNCVFEGGVSRRTKNSDFCSWGEWKDETY